MRVRVRYHKNMNINNNQAPKTIDRPEKSI